MIITCVSSLQHGEGQDMFNLVRNLQDNVIPGHASSANKYLFIDFLSIPDFPNNVIKANVLATKWVGVTRVAQRSV